MKYDQLYSIAIQGLNAEKLRIDLVANNIANQHSLAGIDRTLYQAQQLVTTPKPFNDFIETGEGGFAAMDIVEQQLPPNKVYQPEHPQADKQGYLTYPGISTLDEMTTLLRASRAYEANIKVINTAHGLYLQALTIGEER